MLYIYHLCDEIFELYKSETSHYKFVKWRSAQIRRDIQYVPAKQTEEVVYLENQIEVGTLNHPPPKWLISSHSPLLPHPSPSL